MLAVARQRAHAELPDHGLHSIPKTRQPANPAQTGRDIRFLDNPAQGAQVREV
jgi:hypothetical protein